MNIIGLIHSLSHWKEEMLVNVSAEIRPAALIRPPPAWLGRSYNGVVKAGQSDSFVDGHREYTIEQMSGKRCCFALPFSCTKKKAFFVLFT